MLKKIEEKIYDIEPKKKKEKKEKENEERNNTNETEKETKPVKIIEKVREVPIRQQVNTGRSSRGEDYNRSKRKRNNDYKTNRTSKKKKKRSFSFPSLNFGSRGDRGRDFNGEKFFQSKNQDSYSSVKGTPQRKEKISESSDEISDESSDESSDEDNGDNEDNVYNEDSEKIKTFINNYYLEQLTNLNFCSNIPPPPPLTLLETCNE